MAEQRDGTLLLGLTLIPGFATCLEHQSMFPQSPGWHED